MRADRAESRASMNTDFFSLPNKDRISQSRILVIGDSMLDRYWHGDVERISPEAPVPVVLIKRQDERLGGAANVALNLRSMGAQVSLLSTIGDDLAGHTVRDLVNKNDIKSEFLIDPFMETIVKLRVIGRSHQMLRIDFEKLPDHLILGKMFDRFTDLLRVHDVVLFSDYGKGSLAYIAQMIHMAKEIDKPVLIDPKGSDWSNYSGASLITPNRAELAGVIGEWKDEGQLNDKVMNLRHMLGLQALLLTRSEDGMTLFEADRITSLSAHAREVADVTGAGDTVIATMAIMIACGLNLKQATAWANRAGGLVVEKFGAACLTYEELRG